MSRQRLQGALEGLAVLAAALGLALWQAGSLWGRWTTHYLGGGELEGWLWRYWWMKKMIAAAWSASGVPAGYKAWVAAVAGSYPETGNVLDLQVLSWPLEALLGDPLYYNVKCVLVLTLNGVAGYALGRGVLRDRAGAAVCGLVLALSPYALDEIANGRVRQALVFPLALYALHLARLWRQPSLGEAARAGLWAGLSAGVYLYYGMAAVFFTILFVGWNSLTGAGGGRLDGRRLSLGLLALVVAASVALPFGWSYLDRGSRGQDLPELVWLRDFPSLAELTSPNPETVLRQNDPLLNSVQRFRTDSMPWQHAFMPRYARGIPWLFSLLGLLALPAAWILARRAPADPAPDPGVRSLVPWLAGALFFYLLTLGPYLKTGATGDYVAMATGGVATPYTWLFKYVPAFARLFSPVRMTGMFLVCLGVLAGMTVRCLLPRWPAVRAGAALLVALLALHGMQVSGAVPVATTRIQVPEYYTRLAREPFCTVVELPIRTGDFLQYYQTIHEKKLLLGWADGATPPGFPRGEITKLTQAGDRLGENSFFQFLETLNVHPERPGTFSVEDLRAMTDGLGVRYLVVHERGCEMVAANRGHEHYQQVLAALEEHFGPPVDTSRESAPGRPGPGGVPTLADYELSVFRVDLPTP